MKASPADQLARLPQPGNPRWPDGVPFVEAFRHGSMTLERHAPRDRDLQSPHTRDALPAGDDHRFENFTADFATWVVFYGPEGGEKP